ncbi:MAG: exodeoxyribonuclease V subunit alpha [Azoarcus sp.]|jgi:exodeoxyribonuclease V alpha subunit|nr:exodeoxyribonuclease V subunit alpha [Azoarcus sp.]
MAVLRPSPSFSPSPAYAAREKLAEGFVSQIVCWAKNNEIDAALLARIARELAYAVCDGHVCMPLDALRGVSADEARQVLLGSGVAAEADSSDLGATAYPMVIDGGRLYLRAFFDLEHRLSRALTSLALPLPVDEAAMSRFRAALGALFPSNQDINWQKVAVALALTQRLAIISGGPGTGKTTTVAALIACLAEVTPDVRIVLAAPTGKAAARLREALAARARDLPEAARARLPAEAYTLHRLLGASSTLGRFRHHAANPLALDLLVVDEASMLDLALATSLLDALPPHARLVLLGDKDQLAAVEAGAVFADISNGWCFPKDAAARIEALTKTASDILTKGEGCPAVLPGCVAWLLKSHRFSADSGIGRLAREINAGEGRRALEWLRAQPDAAIRWVEGSAPRSDEFAPHDARPSAAALKAMEEGYATYFEALRAINADESPRSLFAAFERFRILVAVHEGPRGLAAVNAYLERFARAALGIPADTGPFWTGRPIIVLENDSANRLFNGDVGLCLPDAEGVAKVFFPTSDGGFQTMLPSRLPTHDTAFALTVHKSQGSEFAEVLLLLPARPVRALSRELLYTAVTRASRRVTIAGSAEVFEAGCAARNVRFSGLIETLRRQNRHIEGST